MFLDGGAKCRKSVEDFYLGCLTLVRQFPLEDLDAFESSQGNNLCSAKDIGTHFEQTREKVRQPGSKLRIERS